MEARKVNLFRNGRSQALRIPREMEFAGTQVIMHKEGERIIIEPAAPSDLMTWLKTLDLINESIGEIEDFPPDDIII